MEASPDDCIGIWFSSFKGGSHCLLAGGTSFNCFLGLSSVVATGRALSIGLRGMVEDRDDEIWNGDIKKSKSRSKDLNLWGMKQRYEESRSRSEDLNLWMSNQIAFRLYCIKISFKFEKVGRDVNAGA